MNPLRIDPRFLPAQLDLMMTPPPRSAGKNRQPVVERLVSWLRCWQQALIAELAALGAGVEKTL